VNIGAVVLAAGMSRRFGQNKLMVSVKNKPMVGCALDVLEAVGGLKIAAVVSDQDVAAYVQSRNEKVIINKHPCLGQAYSIVLAAEAMQEMDALLFMAADQPKLTAESVSRLLEAFRTGDKDIACLQDETHAGNPAVFSRNCFEELMCLEGDRGAKQLMRKHPQRVLYVPCVYAGELADADNPQALARLMEA